MASLIPEVVARLGGEERAVLQRVTLAWEEAVGPLLGRRARPEALRGKTLFVRVDNSALAHELTLLRVQVVEKLNRAVGLPIATELRTRVGPLEG